MSLVSAFSAPLSGRLRRPRRIALPAFLIPLAAPAIFGSPAPAMAQEMETPTVKVGDPAPDFELQDSQGAAYRLSDYTAKGPVVLEFFRSGGW